jgi:hypothetical protein
MRKIMISPVQNSIAFMDPLTQKLMHVQFNPIVLPKSQ